MQTHDSNPRPSVRHESDNRPTLAANTVAAALSDAIYQIEELKALAALMDASSDTQSGWNQVSPVLSLMHRQLVAISATLETISDSLCGRVSA